MDVVVQTPSPPAKRRRFEGRELLGCAGRAVLMQGADQQLRRSEPPCPLASRHRVASARGVAHGGKPLPCLRLRPPAPHSADMRRLWLLAAPIIPVISSCGPPDTRALRTMACEQAAASLDMQSVTQLDALRKALGVAPGVDPIEECRSLGATMEPRPSANTPEGAEGSTATDEEGTAEEEADER